MRRTPLRRSSMRRSRRVSRYARRLRAVPYMLFVKSLPCSAFAISAEHPCSGPIEADHAGTHAMGNKAPDATVIPICHGHHMQRHDFSGAFRGWTREQMRTWLDGRIYVTQRLAMGQGIKVPTTETT